MRISGAFLVALLLLPLLLLSAGCGTVEESMEETTEETDSWTEPTEVATPPPPPPQDYRIDSLIAENRRLQMQVDAMATETRVLAARNAELEMRLNDALAANRNAPERVAAPAVASTPAPRRTTPASSPSLAVRSSSPPSYAAALAEYKKRNFAGAVTKFQDLLQSDVPEDLEDNAHYWLGESYYGMGRYDDAVAAFEAVFNYAKSDKKDDAQMMVGNAHLASRRMPQAKAAFEELVSAYPGSPFIKRAREKLADLR